MSLMPLDGGKVDGVCRCSVVGKRQKDTKQTFDRGDILGTISLFNLQVLSHDASVCVGGRIVPVACLLAG